MTSKISGLLDSLTQDPSLTFTSSSSPLWSWQLQQSFRTPAGSSHAKRWASPGLSAQDSSQPLYKHRDTDTDYRQETYSHTLQKKTLNQMMISLSDLLNSEVYRCQKCHYSGTRLIKRSMCLIIMQVCMWMVEGTSWSNSLVSWWLVCIKWLYDNTQVTKGSKYCIESVN